MKLFALAMFVVISCNLFAQQELGLAVRNGRLEKSGYSFELVNTSSKPVVGWTMTVEFADGNLRFFEPDSCSLSLRPLSVGGVLPCTLPVKEPKATRLTSVLFADETAVGDLELLDATIEKHWATYREWQYWGKRVHELRSQPDLVSALQTLQREAHEGCRCRRIGIRTVTLLSWLDSKSVA